MIGHDAGIEAANSTRSFQRVAGTRIRAGFAIKDANNNVITFQQTTGNGLIINRYRIE